MHIAFILIIPILIFILLIGIVYIFFRKTPESNTKPSNVLNISMTSVDGIWRITWNSPVEGSNPIGYVYTITTVTTPQTTVQSGDTMNTYVDLKDQGYILGQHYQFSVLPKNKAGQGDISSFVFTISVPATTMVTK